MKGMSTVLVGVVAALLTIAPALQGQDPDDVGIPVGSTPAAPKIEDLSHNTVDLAKYVGHGPVLLEFWAQWCPICKELQPKMTAAYTKYGKQVTFIAVSVAVNETPASIQKHLTEHPVPYQVLWDSGGNATRAFVAVATSYVVILNAKGVVVYTGTGSDQDIDGALAKALKG
ncbi:MAG TPA: TlpA disulfide reductase family protein [Gemmatimonadales bacterium]|nr:TlpA disulfide reductase family protein [Gemmatimonadales bacterium]